MNFTEHLTVRVTSRYPLMTSPPRADHTVRTPMWLSHDVIAYECSTYRQLPAVTEMRISNFLTALSLRTNYSATNQPTQHDACVMTRRQPQSRSVT